VKEALKNKTFEDTHEITDAKMRADAGSLSKYSLKTDLTYLGAALADPTAKNQPNPDNMARPTATTLGGSISARIRTTPETAVSLGAGLSALNPFHGNGRWDLKNPALGFDSAHRDGEYQVRLAPSLAVETVPEFLDRGSVGGFGFVASLVRDIGTSGFAGGIDGIFFYRVFNRDFQEQDGRIGRDVFIISPTLKYNFSDRMNIATSLQKAMWNPRSSRNEWALWPQSLNQRLSLGYAFTKDVYFSPFINFYPEKLAMDTTTLSFSGIFSVM
jgi:hypothetical protein